jgi:hypothetical protein
VQQVVFLVAGPDKEAMVQGMLNDPLSIPAGQAIQHCQSVELWFTVDAYG